MKKIIVILFVLFCFYASMSLSMNLFSNLFLDKKERDRRENLERIKKIPKKDINKLNFDGHSEFHIACEYGNLEAVKLLLEKGAVFGEIYFYHKRFYFEDFYKYIYLADELSKADNKSKFIDNFDKEEKMIIYFKCLANADKEFNKKILHKDFFKKFFPKKYEKDSINFGRKIVYKFLVRRFFAMGYMGFEKKVSIFDNYREILGHKKNYKKLQDCVIKFKNNYFIDLI